MDDWLLQLDIRKLLDKSPVDDAGYITVYEKKESHIERRFTLLNPLPRRHCAFSIKRDHFFSEDTERVSFPVIRRADSHSQKLRISPRFWKYSEKRGVEAALSKDGAMLFDWNHMVSKGTEVTRFTIKESLLRDDLQRHGVCGLWCLDSIRFSEKTLAELELSETREIFRSDTFVYQFMVRHRPGVHFRMQTVSIVMGKRLITA